MLLLTAAFIFCGLPLFLQASDAGPETAPLAVKEASTVSAEDASPLQLSASEPGSSKRNSSILNSSELSSSEEKSSTRSESTAIDISNQSANTTQSSLSTQPGISSVPGTSTQVNSPAPVGGSSMLPGEQIIDIALALLAILALIGVIAWLAKRFSGMSAQSSHHIKTIAVMPLGARERIAVVQIGERQIVVGITPTQITTLLELDQPLDASASGGEFARKLQSLLHRQQNEAIGEVNGVHKST